MIPVAPKIPPAPFPAVVFISPVFLQLNISKSPVSAFPIIPPAMLVPAVIAALF